MPTYYSVRKGQSLQLRPGGRAEVPDSVLGKRDVVFKPLVVRFKELSPGFPVFGLPARNGIAEGILVPSIAVQQIRRNVNELGPTTDKLPKTDQELEDWLVDKLRKHPLMGSAFIEVPDLDEVADGEPLDDGYAPPPGMVTSPVGVIVMAQGRAYCRVCERSMKSSGAPGHSRSKKHIANLRAYEEKLRAPEREAVGT